MPRGEKGAYTDKQKRQAKHIEEGYEKRGVAKSTAEARAWATVNKEDHGGKKSGSGRGTKKDTSSSKKHPTVGTAGHKGGAKGGAASAARPKAARKASAKKAAATRKRRGN
ncbi:MAG: plasmid stabilization protein [Patescibacteria group bacterium]